MKILGIVWEHCSTAALMIDGEIVACVSEERFSRVKNDESYPKRAIETVLAQAGVLAEELDLIALASEQFDPKYLLCRRSTSYSIQDRIREQRDYWHPTLVEHQSRDYLSIFADKVDTSQYPGRWDEVLRALRGEHTDPPSAVFQAFRRRVVAEHLGIDPQRIVFTHHHLGHGYYAYYGSPIRRDPTLILTADAWGDDMNASVSIAAGGRITRLSTSTNCNLGRLYRAMTLLLGMKPDEHEYKVMGLAAYAKPEQLAGPLAVFRQTLAVDGLGFRYDATPTDHYDYFRQRLEGYRFDAIAGGLQRYLEEMLSAWASNALSRTGAKSLCFGGGLAMNVKAMMTLAQRPELEELFVCPSPSDESLAMGACYVAMHDRCLAEGRDPRQVLKPLANAYLGPDLEERELEQTAATLQDTGSYWITPVEDARIAQALAAGRVIGRCVGRSEFGARALGNRSILADPRRREIVPLINEKVKRRDFWMPFAPSILHERSADYLLNPKQLAAPFMTVAFATTPLAQRELPAALHGADATCRPQLVTRGANPAYHRLLSAFESLTGVGALLNTSFNVHGEPIVQSATDAVGVMERTGLDGLILGDLYIEKPASYPATTRRQTVAAGAAA